MGNKSRLKIEKTNKTDKKIAKALLETSSSRSGQAQLSSQSQAQSQTQTLKSVDVDHGLAITENDFVFKERKKLGLAMMVKNEHLRLEISLNSLINIVDCLIIFDTGSTDDTIEILQNFSKTHNIPLHLKQGEFTDFATSRNVLLEFADPFADFLLLMDCNDELQNGPYLRKFVNSEVSPRCIAWLLLQSWFSGHQTDQYENIRLIKTKHDFIYKEPVHEYIHSKKWDNSQKDFDAPASLYKVVLYQDRTQDDDKTGKRFIKDLPILQNCVKKNPNNARAVFYLAQTYMCLRNIRMGYKMSKIRVAMGGWSEEVYHSYMRLGDCAFALNAPWEECFLWYTKAFDCIPRVEPLLRILIHYENKGNFFSAFLYAQQCIDLIYPRFCRLFVNCVAYEYERWHHSSIVAYHVNKHGIALFCNIKALLFPKHDKSDENNFEQSVEKKNFKSFLRIITLSPSSTDPNKLIQIFAAQDEKIKAIVTGQFQIPIADPCGKVIPKLEI